MENLYWRCREFIIHVLPVRLTDLYGTLQILETVVDNILPGGENMAMVTLLVGRLMVFGHGNLEKAGVFDNRRLSPSIRMALSQESSGNEREVQSRCQFVEHKFDRIGERRLHCDCIKRLPIVRFAARMFGSKSDMNRPKVSSVFRVCSGCERWLCLSCHRRKPCTAYPLKTKLILPVTGKLSLQ